MNNIPDQILALWGPDEELMQASAPSACVPADMPSCDADWEGFAASEPVPVVTGLRADSEADELREMTRLADAARLAC